MSNRVRRALSSTLILISVMGMIGALSITDTAYFTNSVDGSLGIVILHSSNGSASFEVSGAGTYAVTIPSEANSVEINNQTVAWPDSGPIELVSGKLCWVRWTLDHWIEIVEKTP